MVWLTKILKWSLNIVDCWASMVWGLILNVLGQETPRVLSFRVLSTPVQPQQLGSLSIPAPLLDPMPARILVIFITCSLLESFVPGQTFLTRKDITLSWCEEKVLRWQAFRFIGWHVLVLCVSAAPLFLVHRSLQASQHPCQLCYRDFISEETEPWLKLDFSNSQARHAPVPVERTEPGRHPDVFLLCPLLPPTGGRYVVGALRHRVGGCGHRLTEWPPVLAACGGGE